jgi:hypothetical protein
MDRMVTQVHSPGEPMNELVILLTARPTGHHASRRLREHCRRVLRRGTHRRSNMCSCGADIRANAVADPTVWQTIDPFFPTRQAEPSCADLTELHGKSARGTPIVLSGQILERDGQPLKDAIVETW